MVRKRAEAMVELARIFEVSVSAIFYGLELSSGVKAEARKKNPIASLFFIVAVVLILAISVPVILSSLNSVSKGESSPTESVFLVENSGDVSETTTSDSSDEAPEYRIVTVDGKEHMLEIGEFFDPAPSEKEGYTFLYYIDADGNKITFPKKIYDDTEVFAKFIVDTYTISYYLNGGEFEGEYATSMTIESGNVVLPVPAKKGSEFIGWYVSADYSGESAESVNYKDKNVTLYAKWDKIVYTVLYELNGGAVDTNPSTVTSDEVITLNAPRKEGYIFDGWYCAADDMIYTRVGGESARNLSLTALWHKISVAVDEYEYFVTEGEVTLTKIKVSNNVSDRGVTEIVIPSFIEGLPVTALGNGTDELIEPLNGEGSYYKISFAENSGIKTINDNTLGNANLISALVLPESVETLGNYSMPTSCPGVMLPDGLKLIKKYAFNSGYGHGRIYVPSNAVVENDVFLNGYYYVYTDDPSVGDKWGAEAVRKVGNTLTLKDGDEQTILHCKHFILPEPEKEGYVFAGWRDTETKILCGSYYVLDRESVTLEAEYVEAFSLGSADEPADYFGKKTEIVLRPYEDYLYLKLPPECPEINISVTVFDARIIADVEYEEYMNLVNYHEELFFEESASYITLCYEGNFEGVVLNQTGWPNVIFTFYNCADPFYLQINFDPYYNCIIGTSFFYGCCPYVKIELGIY
ncbi:MAG: InlB B-repeat-containing protein [Clostridia bacterium]|nr:InlB B-repeat-containing protein [Clostridia bacterium]